MQQNKRQISDSIPIDRFFSFLHEVRNLSLRPMDPGWKSSIFQSSCNILLDLLDCSCVCAGVIDRAEVCLRITASTAPNPHSCYPSFKILEKWLLKIPPDKAHQFKTPLHLKSGADCNLYQLVWPVYDDSTLHGFLLLHVDEQQQSINLDPKVIRAVGEELAFACASGENSLRLQQEREFNQEVTDTIHALLVTIAPCGTILSFNKRAEEVCGYREKDIIGRYWVDVLLNPYDRKKFQRLFSETLKGARTSFTFHASLLSSDGQEHSINWHCSIRHTIDTGTVGLVMIGIDETESLATDQRLHMLTARWEKIFNAIQDPVFVVSNENIILDANPAGCAAARKRRAEVVGRKVCHILHGGHSETISCPLEQFIGYQQTRITETELSGLHGMYMLTVSPLIEENGEINATLLVARNLTEEEVVRAEAIRVAQLAAIGELASGVAHEINNPINIIINYAQIILDDPQDAHVQPHLQNVISEGKRIASIVSNLLSFARCREELYASAQLEDIITNSLQLVDHQLKRDGINCYVDIAPLPPIMCNENQLQQVVLNLISNARYSLNRRFPSPSPEKRLEITAVVRIQKEEWIELEFTDFGTGIAEKIMGRLFDPFFSTKPKGEGTGLGLSVSYGLVRDHGGQIRVKSVQGEFATFVIELPVRPC